MTGAGLVGIGTSAPSTSLHLGNIGAVLRVQATAAGRYVELSSAASGLLKQNIGGVDVQSVQQGLHIGGNEHSTFYTGNYAFVVWGNNGFGKVGIGVTPTTATLQVSGSMIVSVTGQTTTPTLYVGANGRVGIGSTQPAAQLDVYSAGSVPALTLSQTTTVAGLFTGNGLFGSRIGFGEGWSNPLFYVRDGGGLYAQNLLEVQNASGGAIMRITSASLVGIGDITPTVALEVSVTISATNFVGDGSGLTGMGGTPAGISGSIQFKSGTALAGRSDIIVDDAGQVAIGTSNPSATLEISGTMKLAGGTGAEVCDPDHYGQIRRNPTTGAFQICVSR